MFVSAINSIRFFNPFLFSVNKTYLPKKDGRDVFIPSQNVKFCGTSAGAPLRRLKNITDPYFGEKMISVADMPKIEKQLDSCTTVKKAIHILKKYKENMLPVELKIFERLEAASANANRKTFPAILKEWYDDALIKLRLEEFRVIDEIDKMSQELSPETELKVRARTTRCRQSLIDSSSEEPFKRKVIIASIEEIEPKIGEEGVLERLKEFSNKLPRSGTSENAFIVKYAERSHEEIAKRLIRLSLGTVEHIKPDSMGGANDIKNFLLVSASANSMRGNMPLVDFIKQFPQVLINVQNYIEDIIQVIHKGGLKGNQAYPYRVKKTLKAESEGMINLNLSSYKYPYAKAKELEKYDNKSKHKAKRTHR